MRRLFLKVFPLLMAGIVVSGCVTVDPSKREVKVDDAVSSRVAAGMQYLQQGSPSEARRHFSRALSLDEDNAVAHNAMALLYNYEQDEDKQEYHYREALDADPEYSPALNNYGTLLYYQGRYEQALEHFQQAANDPSYEGRGNARSNMGKCYLKLGQRDKAKAAFNRALRINPRAVQPNLELAELYYRDNRLRQAWEYHRQYERRIGRQSARGLWLGIRLAAALGREDQQSSYELALGNLYRRSSEYRQWQQWKAEQEKQ